MARKCPTGAPPPSNWRRRPRQGRSRQPVDALLVAATEIFAAQVTSPQGEAVDPRAAEAGTTFSEEGRPFVTAARTTAFYTGL